MSDAATPPGRATRRWRRVDGWDYVLGLVREAADRAAPETGHPSGPHFAWRGPGDDPTEVDTTQRDASTTSDEPDAPTEVEPTEGDGSDSDDSALRTGVVTPSQSFPTRYGAITLHMLYDREYSYRRRRGARRGAPTVGDTRCYFWSPPLRPFERDDRVFADGLRNCLEGRKHGGERWIWATLAARHIFTSNRHATLVRDAIACREPTCALLPGCVWCGIPCGGWCEGFNDWTGPEGWQINFTCDRPVCSACKAAMGVCDSCCFWVGLGELARSPDLVEV